MEAGPRRARAAVLFLAVLLLPHAVFGAAYGVVAALAAVPAWLCAVVAGRVPAAVLRFEEGYVRYAARAGAYGLLLTDRYPPFGPGRGDDAYPLVVAAAGERRRSRALALVRLPVALPAALVVALLGVVALVVLPVAWVAALALGRVPASVAEVLELAGRFGARFTAFALLVTDRYPWFQPEAGDAPRQWLLAGGDGVSPPEAARAAEAPDAPRGAVPAADGDWRLLRELPAGLQGAAFAWRPFTAAAGEPQATCELCWARFGERPGPDVLTEGWTPAEDVPPGRHWVCPRCFDEVGPRHGFWRA